MSGSNLHRLDAVELRALYARRALSPLELVDELISRVERLEPHLKAFVHFDPDATRAEAKLLERRFGERDQLPPLFGLPVPVKDLVPVRGMPFTRGSKLFEGHAAEDVPVVARLREAGAIIFGKTTTSEFGWKAATATPLFPDQAAVPRQPYRPNSAPSRSAPMPLDRCAFLPRSAGSTP